MIRSRILFFLIGWVTPHLISAKEIPKYDFFDSHVHLNKSDQADYIQKQLSLMDKKGISKAVIFTGGRGSENPYILEAAAKHPDRFIPFVSVSPEKLTYRKKWKTGDESLLSDLKKELDTGKYKGIGEISVVHFPFGRGGPENEFSPLGKIMKGIMRLAQEYDLPINIHCEITYIKEFEELLRQFRGVRVIWAHGGYADYFLTRRLLKNNPNLFIELSMRSYRIGQGHPRSPDYTILKDGNEIWPKWKALIEQYQNRFIVGSDASQRRSESDVEKIDSTNLLLSQLSDSARKCVATENLKRLLKFSDTRPCWQQKQFKKRKRKRLKK